MDGLHKRLIGAQQALTAKVEQKKTIPFGEWLPDQPSFGNPGALTVENVIPIAGGYRPFPGSQPQTDSLDSEPLGTLSARDASNNIFVYAGDAGKLYELRDYLWNDESKGGGYSTAVDDVWEFAVFGNTVVATNFTDPVQSIAIGGGAAGAFADLMTSTLTPKAKHLDTLRQFLVLGNTNDATDGHVPNRVWWSAIRDAADFDPDSTTQCDYEDLRQGGWVQAVVGGAEYGVIFQEQQITRMEYVGAPAVFAFYPVIRDRGTPIPNSVVGFGRDVFYISDIGFERFTGTGSIPIGSDKVDRTFWNAFDVANKKQVSAAIDPVNKLVAWALPLDSSAPNTLFVYNWVLDRWAKVTYGGSILVRTNTQGYTLETLDNVGTNIDDEAVFSESLDSEVWKGGKVRFAQFNNQYQLAYFTGSPIAAIIDTGEVQLTPGRRSLVRSLRPIIDGEGLDEIKTHIFAGGGGNLAAGPATGLIAQISSRSNLSQSADFASGPPAFGDIIQMDSIGVFSVRDNNRYHRFRHLIADSTDWLYAQGVEVTYVPMGDK